MTQESSDYDTLIRRKMSNKSSSKYSLAKLRGPTSSTKSITPSSTTGTSASSRTSAVKLKVQTTLHSMPLVSSPSSAPLDQSTRASLPSPAPKSAQEPRSSALSRTSSNASSTRSSRSSVSFQEPEPDRKKRSDSKDPWNDPKLVKLIRTPYPHPTRPSKKRPDDNTTRSN